MRAWPAPDFRRADRLGPAVRLFNTATAAVEETRPEGTARLYVCGITPYDATHMGHAATYVSFDLLLRAWRNAGHDVRYVQNVTDVDDPLLERADAVKVDWVALAERETELFREDMTALRVVPPDAYVGAVESIPWVIELIELLQAQGAIYELEGDLYFSVASDPGFGAVSGWERERMLEIFGERGGDPQRPGKRDPLDCLVWLAERPGEPSWDSPFGLGRPGWHIECTAIARQELGAAFDVQGGGSDLIFPHHEMCAAEAQAADPQHPFARGYAHVGMVGLDGEKMSKSRGNLVFVSHLRRAEVDPMAIRLTLLGHHYREEWEWFDDELWAAGQRLDRWRLAVAKGAGAPAEPVVQGVLAALADDLQAPAAVELVDQWATETLEGGSPGEEGAGERVRLVIDAALGVAL